MPHVATVTKGDEAVSNRKPCFHIVPNCSLRDSAVFTHDVGLEAQMLPQMMRRLVPRLGQVGAVDHGDHLRRIYFRGRSSDSDACRIANPT
jgi:hypothetical protein